MIPRARTAAVAGDVDLFALAEDRPAVEMLPGFWRRTLVWGDELCLVQFRMRKGAQLPDHHHPHEQVGFVLEGDVTMTVAGEEHRTPRGCCYFPYSGQVHGAEVLDDSVVVDAFSPLREDYLPGYDGPADAAYSGEPCPGAGKGRPNSLGRDQAKAEQEAAGVERLQLLSGDRIRMSLLQLAEGAELAETRVIKEMATYVMSGEIRWTMAGETRTLGPDSAALARAGQPVAATSVTPTELICVEALSQPA